MKILACATAIALAASSLLAASPADAQGWRHHHRGGGRGGAIAGFAAGAILGGMLAAQRPYGYYAPGYDYGPGYYEPGYVEGDDAVGYCLSRFRSYDPRSGTYLGFDGYRHPCP